MFILAIIFALIAVALFFVARVMRKNAKEAGYTTGLPRWITLGASALLVLALIFGAFSCVFKVPPKTYAALSTFGKVHGNYPSGLHAKLPWEKKVTVDGRIKGYAFGDVENAKGYDESFDGLPATLGNGSPTTVAATIRWQVNESDASDLYKSYGSTGDPTAHFGHVVVQAQFQQVVADVVRTYNPINQLEVVKNGKGTTQNVATFAPDYDELSQQALEQMKTRVGTAATILSVTITEVPLDKGTQDKLSQFNQEQAKSRTAAQAIVTNTNQARANKKLESSLEQSPGLLIKQCLDTVATAEQSGYQLPQTFNCANLLAGNGGNTSVILPSQPSSK